MNRRPDFFEKYANLKQPYCFIKAHWSIKFHEIEKRQLFYLVNKLTKLFAALGLYEMKT